jgi:hypothetical protein
MATRMWQAGAVTVLAALTSACASMGGKQTDPDGSLAGSWVMSATASEAGLPGDSAGWASVEGHGGRTGAGAGSGGRGGRAGGGGMSGGRGGMGGGGGGMRGGAGAVDVAAVRAALESIMARQERLVLHLEDDVVQVRASTETPVRLGLDARWQEVTLPGGAEAHARAAWRNHGLVVEHRHNGGITVRETFIRQRGTDRMVVTIRVSGAGPTHRETVVVYDREESSAPRPGAVDRSAGPPRLAARGM